MNNRVFNLILIGMGLLLFSACAPVVKYDQIAHTEWVTLESGHSLGQTLTARYAGLQGIAILVESESAHEGSLDFNLYSFDDRQTPLRTVSLPLTALNPGQFQQFAFRSLPLSNQQDYYLQITLQGTENVRVATGPGASYLSGSAYLDEVAQDRQIVFRLIYSPGMAIRGLLIESMGWLFRLSMGVLLFVIPGWGILSMVFPGWRNIFWIEKIGLAAGVSLIIFPILLLWTHLIGLRLGIFTAWIPILAGISFMFWKFANRPHTLASIRKKSGAEILCDLAYIAILIMLLFSRLWSIRGLDAPLWGDSLQHTMISQLIVDHNGLFTSWAPYAEITSFTYHFGFHSLVAAFHWMTGLEMAQSVLWTGQIINVLALVVLVPLANRLSASRWAGLAALMTAGLFSSIPQVYTNWGRYTQLTGQIILVVFIYIAWIFFGEQSKKLTLASLTALLLAGLGLTHSRVLIFALIFLLLLLAYLIVRLRPTGFRPLFKPILLTGGMSLLLFSPWLWRIMPSTTAQIFVAQINSTVNQVTSTNTQPEAFVQYIGMIPVYLWWISGAALLLALWRRDIEVGIFTVWCLIVLLVGYPYWVGLPGAGIVGGFTVMIAAYIPVGVFTGYLMAWIIETVQKKATNPLQQTAFIFAVFLLTIAAGLTGIRPRLRDIKVMESALFTRADQRAAEWIDANLPQESFILVNSFLAYDSTVAVGSDGGWWLPIKAQRAITLPPINYSLEDGPTPDYRERVREIPKAILEKGINDPEVQRLLDERGITHIYLGQQQGSVNYAGPPIQPEQLLAMDNFTPIYHEDRVWIFERNRP